MSKAPFNLGWEAGASSAQIELFSPGASETYRLRYTAPFRTTIRPPLEELKLGPEELDPIRMKMEGLVSPAANRGGGAAADPADDVLRNATELGQQLVDLIIPSDVQADLRTPGQFLEMGIDQGMLEYPWELMHDGDEFLCLKHFMGRFVNLTTPHIPSRERAESLTPGPLRVLLISVPQPQKRGDKEFELLKFAEQETKSIVDLLAGMGDSVELDLLKGNKATRDEVWKKFRKGSARYHIVHYNGHAYFNKDKPHLSSLVLFDQDLTTGPIVNFLGKRPPALFFMNACETATSKPGGKEWDRRYDIFGLARAFLETGAYLVGSRWKVGDQAAAAFATQFYTSLVAGQSLGRGVRDARQKCKDASTADDLSWASYTFYGDPRLRFQGS